MRWVLLKEMSHPKAFLSHTRNIRPGLKARTQIIQALEAKGLKVKGIGDVTRLSYKVVLHHLKMLEAERVVTSKGNKPHVWELTGAGQQRLVNRTSH